MLFVLKEWVLIVLSDRLYHMVDAWQVIVKLYCSHSRFDMIMGKGSKLFPYVYHVHQRYGAQWMVLLHSQHDIHIIRVDDQSIDWWTLSFG